MIRNRAAVIVGCVSLVGLGIWGCGSASAADGAQSTSTRSPLATPTQPIPPSRPADSPPSKPPADGMPPKPPPEAFAACKGLTEGTSCTVTIHDHTIDGTCRNAPDGSGQLFCVPAGMPGPPPSQSAIIDSSALEHRLDQLEKGLERR